MEHFERIRNLREDKDITQEELCKKLNISQQSLSKYENNQRKLPIDLLKRYAQVFNVSSDYILGLTDNPKPNWSIKNQLNINGGNIGKITMKWGKIMSPEQFGNLINEGLFSGLYKAFELLFLTPPTCYIVYGMIVFTVALKILEKIIKKNRK